MKPGSSGYKTNALTQASYSIIEESSLYLFILEKTGLGGTMESKGSRKLFVK